MTHIPEGLDDTFSNSVKIKSNCTASKFIGDGSAITGLSVTESDPVWLAAKGTYDSHLSDGTIHFTSNALWTAIDLNTAKTSYTDAALVSATVASCAINTAKITYDDAALVASTVASCALNTTHRGDASDPHGATLTQTNISVTSAARTGDVSVSGAAYIPNIVFGTASAAHTVSDYTQGTLLIIYS